MKLDTLSTFCTERCLHWAIAIVAGTDRQGRPWRMSAHTQAAIARQSRIRTARIRRTQRIGLGVSSDFANPRWEARLVGGERLPLRKSCWPPSRTESVLVEHGFSVSVGRLKESYMECLIALWPEDCASVPSRLMIDEVGRSACVLTLPHGNGCKCHAKRPANRISGHPSSPEQTACLAAQRLQTNSAGRG